MFNPSKLNFDAENKNRKDIPKEKQEDVLGNLEVEKAPEIEETKKELKNDDFEKKNLELESVSKEPVSVGEKKFEEKTIDERDKELSSSTEQDTSSTIFDVNISSLKELLTLIIDKEYDFATFEPDDEKVEITFRKDKIIVDQKYIKYPVYSNMLLKAKALTKLKLDETKKEQEGKGEATIESKNYNIITKVVPGNFGEKLFLKAKESNNQTKQLKKQKQKNIGQLFSFLGAALVVLLIVGGGFLSFIVLNARTVDDVQFFKSLGISLNQINSFIGSIVFLTFSVLLLIMTVFLVIFLFKFLLTKKTFKQNKIKYGILSALFFIMTFSTAGAWMFVNQQINNLPEWANEARGEIQLYDNAKLNAKGVFGKEGAYIADASSLIGPVEIEFDLGVLASKESKKGGTIEKYIWTFGKEEVVSTTPKIIRNFTEKGITEIGLKIVKKDASGEIKEYDISGVPTVNISNVVKITRRPGKLYALDASDLKSLGQPEWYDLGNLDEPIFKGYNYITGKPVLDQELIGLYLRKEGKISEVLDKIFVLRGEEKSKLAGEISVKRNPINDLEYSFGVSNLEVDNGAGTVEKFLWTIENKEYSKDIKDIEDVNENWNLKDIEKIAQIQHEFKSYGEKTIKLEITDSAGNKKFLSKKINIEKQANLRTGLKIFADGKILSNIKYKPSVGDYYLNDLGVPVKLVFDARLVKSDNILYLLDKVSWDYDGDGTIDHIGKRGQYEIVKSGSHNIKVYYEFKNRKLAKDILKIEENIYIEAVKKEAIVDFNIVKKSSYVPVNVSFDASRSTVKEKNISKFVWDYGDGIKEERDSVVPAHRYTEAGEYKVKLTIITDDGIKYDVVKNLILKPTAQTVKIKPSMKKAPVFQEIDFLSSDSSGDITGYLWNFGDGNTSTKANPSHFFKQAGTYKVKLTLYFRNRNVMEDYVNIEIVK